MLFRSQAEISEDADNDNFNYDSNGKAKNFFPLSYNYTIRKFTARDSETGKLTFTQLNGDITNSATTITVDSKIGRASCRERV